MSPDDELPPTVSREACTLRQLIRQRTFPDTGTRSDVLPRVRRRDSARFHGYAPGVAHYIFNSVKGDSAKRPALREQAAGFLRAGMWGIGADEPHGHALGPGDLVLIYLGAPEREFIGRAELASRGCMIGHRPRRRCTPAIALAEWCWLKSRNGTRPCR